MSYFTLGRIYYIEGSAFDFRGDLAFAQKDCSIKAKVMKTTKTFSIHFWLKKTAKRKKSEIPVYARITVDGIRADISLKRFVNENHWCARSGRLNQRFKNAKGINDYLDDVYSRLLECHRQILSESTLVTAQSIKMRYLGKDKKVNTLMELIKHHRENEMGKLETGTAKNYGATEEYLGRFLRKTYKLTDVSLATLDYAFLNEFDNYLRNCPPLQKARPLSNNGIMKHMERFQKMLNVATKYGWIKLNPFALYQLKFEDYDSDFLEANEISELESLDIPEPGLRIVRDIFIFSCFTGLSYIEVKLLKPADVVEGFDGEEWINVRRKKTKTQVKVPLLQKAKEILKRYSNYPGSDQRLLPVYSNQIVNKNLKILAYRAKIKKHLTFHVARHTFATTVTLLNDVPLETVSKLLGHTKLSTTQKYARVVEKKISKDFQKLKQAIEPLRSDIVSAENSMPSHLKVVR